MKHNPSVNVVRINSLPLKRDFKRYFVKKYEHLVEHNGVEFAVEKFKHLKAVLLKYRSDPNRSKSVDHYYKICGFRTNGRIRQMFEYVDSHPEIILQFVKLYSELGRINVDEVSVEYSDTLTSINSNTVNTDTPRYLTRWLDILNLSLKKKLELYYLIKSKTGIGKHYPDFRYFCTSHSIDEWMSYWKRWFSILVRPLLKNKELSLDDVKSKAVYPALYSDYTDEDSVQHTQDLANLASILSFAHPLSIKTRGYLEEYLPNDLVDQCSILDQQAKGYYGRLEGESVMPNWKMCGKIVGNIHFIPKGGKGYRPIAVPNRYLQQGLNPLRKWMSTLVQHLPQDATYDQSKFDHKIHSRVSDDNLYVGSVDLSSATDNLPAQWGIEIIQSLKGQISVDPVLEKSLELFVEMSRGPWACGEELVSWNVGQPLGTLPSFNMLALTHNLYLEALSLACGYHHSPYSVLGDDVVMYHKKLRDAYIKDMRNRKIPLSLHKSFAGNLTEFAGKTYVKNMQPFHTPDHGSITFESLFDWQYTSGVKIPWVYLPIKLKEQFKRRYQHLGINKNPSEEICIKDYNTIQSCIVFALGSGYTQLSKKRGTLIEIFYSLLPENEDVNPSPNKTSGIIKFSNTVGRSQLGLSTDEEFILSDVKDGCPDWFKEKFRPVTTDVLLKTAHQTNLTYDKLSS